MNKLRVKSRTQLLFVHIQKTAGTAVREFLRCQYRSEDICPANDWTDINIQSVDLNKYKLIFGHFGLNVLQLFNVEPVSLCIFREPVSRTVSSLKHVMRDSSYSEFFERAQSRSLSDIIRDPAIMERYRDTQTKVLCASSHFSFVNSYISKKMRSGASIIDSNEILTFTEGDPDIAFAIDKLKTINFIGTTENIEECISLLSIEMRFHPIQKLAIRNEAQSIELSSQDLSDEDLRIIRSYNSMDIELYEKLSENALKRSSAGKISLNNRNYKDTLGSLFQKDQYEIDCDDYFIDISAPIPGSGWYPHEVGEHHRWTGPLPEFTLDLPYTLHRAQQLIIYFIPIKESIVGSLKVSINENIVKFSLNREDEIFRMEINVPVDSSLSQFFSVKISISQLYSPAELGIGDDIRKLGIAVTAISCIIRSSE